MSHSPSPHTQTLHWGRHLVSAIALATLAACGGGGDTPAAGTTTTPPSTAISGTVATGAAVSGTVTAKDANGLIRTGTIAADGSYRIDVSGLQAPFLVRAVGTAGNKQIVLTAPVRAADFNNTINITPLSDLIVANLGGQAAEAFFSAPDFSKLDNASIASALLDLQTKLAPMLEAAGLSNVDFLRVPFATDHTGLDGLLDVLEINVNGATRTATIVSKITGDTVTDNLQARGTQDTTRMSMSEANKALVTQTTSDPVKTGRLADVQALLNQYNALFATAMPSQAALMALCAPDFVDPDGDCAAWANGQIGHGYVGSRALLTRIVAFDATQPDNIDADKTASGDISDSNLGVLVRNDEGFGVDQTATLLSKVGGQWKIAGQRREVYISLEGSAYQALSIAANGTQTVNYSGAGLYIGIGNGTSDVTRALVTGPGLPEEGVELTRPTTNSNFQFTNGGGSLWNQLSNSTLTSASLYTIKVYNGGNATPVGTYRQHLATKSVPTLAQAQGQFAALLTNVNAAWCSSFGGLIEWTKPEGSVNSSLRALCSSGAASLEGNGFKPTANDQATLSISSSFMPEIATQATSSYVKIEVRDADGVNYSTEVTRYFATSGSGSGTTQGSTIDGPFGLVVLPGTRAALEGQTLFSAAGDTWYSELCDSDQQLLAINFDSTVGVSLQTNLSLLTTDRTFTPVKCAEPNRAAQSLKFNADGTATSRKDGSTQTFSSAAVQTILTSVTPPDETGLSSAIRFFKATVNGIENYFLAEMDTKSDGSFSLFFWKEVFALLN